jgi:hypothetical protein
MGTGEFLDGIGQRLRRRLPPELGELHGQRRYSLLKLWYHEARLHYEVWPITGRALLEVGLHFEADAAVNHHLLTWFDPHMVELTATMDGAVELEPWTASWGHLFHVFPAPSLDPALQTTVVDWLARLVPLAEPLLRSGLATAGPLTTVERQPRDWEAWRRRRARRRELAQAGQSIG